MVPEMMFNNYMPGSTQTPYLAYVNQTLINGGFCGSGPDPDSSTITNFYDNSIPYKTKINPNNPENEGTPTSVTTTGVELMMQVL